MELAATRQAERLEKPLRLADLTDWVREAARGCRDYSGVALHDTAVLEDGTWRYNGKSGQLSRHALAQLCARLSLPGGGTVPASYLARCPSLLAAENLNHWLQQPERNGQHVLVRTRESGAFGPPTVRAILSDRYAAVDHLPLLETLGAEVAQHDLEVQAWSLDDEQFTLRLVAKGDHPVSLKDPLRVGLHVSNSEIGLGRISITALITRLVCTNGLVVKVAELEGIHRRHIGRAGESLQTVVQQGLPHVLEEADHAARRFSALREAPVPEPVETFVRKTAERADLPETVVPIAAALLEGETIYDVINAFTQAAQRFPVAERLQIETAMSRFLRDRRS